VSEAIMTEASDTTTGGKAYLECVGFMADGNPCSFVLSEVENTEFLGGRCIRGRLRYSGQNHFMAEKLMYVPVERVITATEYESYEAYREAVKRHYAEKAG
jgi:hypothetical protein